MEKLKRKITKVALEGAAQTVMVCDREKERQRELNLRTVWGNYSVGPRRRQGYINLRLFKNALQMAFEARSNGSTFPSAGPDSHN